MEGKEMIDIYREEIKQLIESESSTEYLQGVYTFAKHYNPQSADK